MEDFCFSSLTFLKKHSYLFDFPITKIVQQDSIEKIPPEWKLGLIESEDLLQFINFDFKNLPSLIEFFKMCNDFSCEGKVYGSLFGLPPNLLRIQESNKEILLNSKHMSPKKCHEIQMLVRLLKQVGSKVKSWKCLDVGSGLGYLGSTLHQNLGYKVFCFENDPKKIISARNIQDELIGDCPSRPTHHEWHIEDNDSCLLKAKQFTEGLKNSNDLCICSHEKQSSQDLNDLPMLLSLHSCADLSPIMLKMFKNIDSISALISLPCCYHKLKPVHNTQEANLEDSCHFVNFPLSSTVKKIFSIVNFSLNVYALRLASEQFSLNWKKKSKEKIMEDVKNLFFRSILEKVCTKYNIAYKKTKKRFARKSNYEDFDGYVHLVLEHHDFRFSSSEKSPSLTFLKDQLKQTYLEEKDKLPLIGLFKILQLSLQPVLEAVLLMDFVFFLRESGFENSGIVKVFDKCISPRNVSVIALKSQYLT